MGEGMRLTAFQLLVGDVLNVLPAKELRLPALEALSRQIKALPKDQMVPVKQAEPEGEKVPVQLSALWQLRCEIQKVSTDPLLADRLALKVSSDLPLSDPHRAALLSSIIDQSATLPQAHRSTLHREVHQMVLSAQLY